MIDPNQLKVAELKNELTARGLSTKGLKKDLVTRLEEALQAENATSTPTESTSNPDTAPKAQSDEKIDNDSTDINSSDNSGKDGDDDEAEKSSDINNNTNNTEKDSSVATTTTTTTTTTATIASEAKEIAHITQPIPEPLEDSAESDIIVDPVPIPAIHENVVSKSPTVLKPVVGTPSLEQEGLIDTIMDQTIVTTESTDNNTSTSKKRTLEDDGEKNQSSKDKSDGASTKRQKNSETTTANDQSMEVDTRQSSSSPATDSASSKNSAPPPPVSPTSTRTPGKKLDMRTIMENQIKLAAKDRQPDANKPAGSSPVAQKSSESKEGDSSKGEEAKNGDTAEVTKTRALAITNFIRPLTVNQVKRMLSEFGEVEVLWMDSIRTHCYVTFKDEASAEKAYTQVKGLVFPKETGKPLVPHYITPEDAVLSIQQAEEAQKSGKRAVPYTGATPLVTAPKRGAPIALGSGEIEVFFKRDKVEQPQVVQPADLFKMTKTQPALYYKPVKEPPSASLDVEPSTAPAPVQESTVESA